MVTCANVMSKATGDPSGKFPYNGEGNGMILADIAIHLPEENGLDAGLHPSKLHRKKHRKKKGLGGGGDGEVNGLVVNVNNPDNDIVTPYQNGHYLQPPPPNRMGRNGYNYRSRSISNEDDFEDDLDEDNDGGRLLLAQPSYGDFLSPQPSLHNLLLDERGAHSSLSSVNNAITVAPSRNNLNDSNVFAGGRPNNLKRANQNNHHQRNNRHHKHKGRSRTPDFTTSSNHRLRLDQEPHQDSQSILNRIDLSIRKKFGDWDDDDGEVAKKLQSNGNLGGCASKKLSKTPYFIPKTVASDSDIGVRDAAAEVNLPRLFKSYDSVVTNAKQVLHEKSYMTALSRDNADPNSILSQAKKTLSMMNGS